MVLGPLLFLIYITDLPDGITSICKIFADDTSFFFSKVQDINRSADELNCDLEKVSNWAYQSVKFNKNNITKCSYQKHLGIVVDSKLNFNTHNDQKNKKCNNK